MSFARGLSEDYGAVMNALRYEWSNGQLEGHTTPGGQRALRRPRSRCPGERSQHALDRLAGALCDIELTVFRF